jgi:aryl-alcohol dehydrogenase-like predicted oxidoreductase
MSTDAPTVSLPGGTWSLGDLTVTRFGYGAMQLAGPGVMGPPADRDGALAVLRTAVDLGITHLDTADAYGPRVTNELIREALHPYPESLHIVTKVGANRDEQGGWPPPGGPRTCASRSTRTWRPSASSGSTWSTSGSATHRARGPARSPRRSAPWSSSSGRA